MVAMETAEVERALRAAAPRPDGTAWPLLVAEAAFARLTTRLR